MSQSVQGLDGQIASMLADPAFYLWRFEAGKALFIKMDQEAFQNSIFLDQRIVPASKQVSSINLGRVIEVHNKRPPPAPKNCYIFHVAHCGSTLLSRALDFGRASTVYREPLALRQLSLSAVNSSAFEKPPELWLRQLELVTWLLGRSFDGGQSTIKANVPVNFIIPHLMGAGAATRGIILYATFENYLLSILKTEMHRGWAQRIVERLGPGIDAVVGTSPSERGALTLGQTAACLWLAQMTLFSDALKKFQNLRTLDAEVLFNQSAEAVAATATFFGQDLDPESLDRLMQSELFSTYSKNPNQQYDNEQRKAEKERTKSELADLLSEARTWIEQRKETVALPDALDRPLVGKSASLM
jgi:hypothetical protein